MLVDFLSGWVTNSPTTYLVILALAVADIIGIVPAETVLVTAVVLALQGPLWVAGVALAAIVGAIIGDNVLYFLGRKVGPPLIGRVFRSERSKERLDWARRNMHRHRVLVIVAGRFLPGGRTVVMFAAGLLNVPWRRFVVPEVLAVLLWATYYVCVPVLFGDQLAGWATIVLALGVAVVVGGVAELVRRYTERRSSAAGR